MKILYRTHTAKWLEIVNIAVKSIFPPFMEKFTWDLVRIPEHVMIECPI